MSQVFPVLIGSGWKASAGTRTFVAENPATGEALPGSYPVSPWSDVEEALRTAHAAWRGTRDWGGERFAKFLERYAELIEAGAGELVAMAHAETGLPVEPRLAKAELPRTVNQLRQAAGAARSGSWLHPIIDRTNNIRSCFAPVGPVCVFGPNNFPFAFNGIAGGDFAAAIAAGNPVIAKAHSSHPGTSRLFAEVAKRAADETGLPHGFVQMIYRIEHADGERLVSHRLLGATGYTGARETGLVLKAAADRVGKPIYMELSSINPVVVLPGVLRERLEAMADEFASSCLMGTGQFCTNPGLVLLLAGTGTETFVEAVAERFRNAPVGTLLSRGVLGHLERSVTTIAGAGARVVAGGATGGGKGYSHQNTLLRATARQFLDNPTAFQTEAFGNESLFVVCQDEAELLAVLEELEGNLTGAVYSAKDGSDDALYGRLIAPLREKVGRLLNDKMPTGVAVSPAMNHGGPFPATGHPVFTAVGIPASIRRFTRLECYDAIRPERLPPALRDANPSGKLWREIDGVWTCADLVPA